MDLMQEKTIRPLTIIRPLTMALSILGSAWVVSLAPTPAHASTIYTGNLEPGDAIFAYDGSLYDGYPIQGEVGQKISIQLHSDEFDPFLAIVGPNGEWLAQNDDINNLDQNSALSFTFPNDDTYYVFVNAYSVEGRGAYTLELSVNRSNSEDDGIIVPAAPSSMPPPAILNSTGTEGVLPDGNGLADSIDSGTADSGTADSGTADSGTADSSTIDETIEPEINLNNPLTPSIELAQHTPDSSQAETEGAITDQETLLSVHNRYRTEVGVASLQWSDEIAASAQQWADHLATIGTLAHSGVHYGENIWAGTAGAFSVADMVEAWGDEKQYFVPSTEFPDVSTTGNWTDVGHYTQIVWQDTTEVGCAIATGGGQDILVCQYNPPGNVQGEKPFE